MARDDGYPFPIDQLLPDQATAEEVASYEETVVVLLNEWIEEHGGSVHGESGVLLFVTIDGHGLTRRLRLHYRSHAAGEYDAYLPVWGDQGMADPPMAAGRPSLETPASLGGLVTANWADGSIHAEDDPYWAAVERQRHAIDDWLAAYPEAAAALPERRRNETIEQLRAALEEWERQFPEAAARRREVWRPVKDFL